MTKAQHGVYAAAITPMREDGTPDLDKLVQYSQRIISEGLTGVAPAGTTGEGNSLPSKSRLEMPAKFADAGIASDRVIFGTGACATDDAVALTRACVDAGYTNVLVLPPFYLKNVPEDGLFAYYARLIERVASNDLRVYLYHFPQMSMTPIPVTLIARLKEAFGPVIAGLKDSSGDYEGSLKFVQAADDFDVFPSNEGVLLQGQQDGCAGVISATVNAAPDLAGRTLTEKTADLQENLLNLRKLISAFPLSAALKQIEAWKSSDDSWLGVYPPLVELTAAQKTELRDQLAQFENQTGVKVL